MANKTKTSKAKTSKSGKTVAATVVRALQDLGVKHVFGVPSGGWVDYMEELRTAKGIDFILATHEGGAGMMADVCGRMTGVPVVLNTSFNENEPIVHRPEEALDCFLRTDMDALALGPFVLRKR